MGKISGQQAREALDKWDAYIDEYEDGLAVKKTQMESILNNPSATQEEKDNARKTYEIQKAHLDELIFKRSQLQIQFVNDGEIDDTITFGVNGKMAMFVYQTVVGGQKYTGYARNAWPPNVFVSSQHFNLYFETTGSWGLISNIGTTILEFGIEALGWNTKTYNMKDLNHFSPDTGEVIIYGGQGITFGVHVKLNDNADDVIPEGTQLYGHYFMSGILVELPRNTVPTETPWDYYNDDLEDLFDDPNIEVFPDGYTPPGPHTPTEEPDITDEDIDEGDLPTLHPDNILTSPSQFITQYILNSSELAYIGNMLWTSWLDANSDVWQNFLFNFASQTGTFNITAALDYVISLRVYPFDLIFMYGTDPPQDFFGTSYGVYMGTGKTNFLANSGITEVKTINSVCGAINLGTCKVESDKPYNDFRDMYNASAICYLPFCGTVKLNPVDIWGRTLRCYYFIDFQSGGCTAVVECQGDVGWFPVASKSGQIGYTIPLTATNAGQLASTFARDATQALGTMIAWGTSFDKKSSINENIESTANLGLSLADQAINMLSRSGVDMPMLSGGSGCEGIMMYHTPFIDIRRGKYAKPDNYPHSIGYVNSTSSQISEYHGMNQFTGIDASGLDCHDDEKAEIIRLLESGVYLP